jgi:ABC-type phosphonate transport system ATPase subunit
MEATQALLSPPRPTPHIEVDRLELYYGSVPAVRGVSFNVFPGEQLTLLGPPSPVLSSRPRAKFASVGSRSIRRNAASIYAPRNAACRWCSNPTPFGRI